MTDLVTWLRAQLDEEAEDAQALGELFSGGGSWTATRDEIPDVAVAQTSSHIRHIARWDPARVLAEVDAKRRMIDLIVHLDEHDGECAPRLLEALALPYADRPGFDPAWAPVEGHMSGR